MKKIEILFLAVYNGNEPSVDCVQSWRGKWPTQ